MLEYYNFNGDAALLNDHLILYTLFQMPEAVSGSDMSEPDGFRTMILPRTKGTWNKKGR